MNSNGSSSNGTKQLATWLLLGILLIGVVTIIVVVIKVETKSLATPSKDSNDQTLAISSSTNTDGMQFPADGYYATLNQAEDASFYGSQANATAKPAGIHPNEAMLAEIRRERYNYRERISNRMNMNSYAYPNMNGWWPRASYAGQVRLEPGQWPKISEPPFNVPFRTEVKPCGPNNPATYSGPDNSGVVVQNFGRLTRRGMCYQGRADCPMGQTAVGADCVGIAARDFAGNLIWSRSELAAPISQVANLANNEQQWEGAPLVSSGSGGL